MLSPDSEKCCLAVTPSGIYRQHTRSLERSDEVSQDLDRFLSFQQIVLERIVGGHFNVFCLNTHFNIHTFQETRLCGYLAGLADAGPQFARNELWKKRIPQTTQRTGFPGCCAG